MNRFVPLAVVFLLGLIAVANSPAQKKDKTPTVNYAVTANNDLAFDLYAQLAGGEAKDKNLFFSPYSISNAMAIVAEGARNETADEMGKVLRYPNAVRAEGKEQPWELGPIHEGTVSLNKRLEAANKPAPKAVTDKLATLRKQLAKELAARDSAAREDLDEKQALKEILEDLDRLGKVEQLAAEIKKVQAQINPFEIRIANSLWAEKTYPFRRGYRDAIDKRYGEILFPVDFIKNAEANRKKINSWVEEKTRDRIKDLIPSEAIDGNTRLVVANAIYFKGDWDEPFQQHMTKDRPFTLADGKKTIDVAMMAGLKHGARYAAFDKDGTFFETPTRVKLDRKQYDTKGLYPGPAGFEMVELPYLGGEVSMVVIAPRSATGLPALEKLLSSADLQTWAGKLRQRDVEVSVPKLKLELPFDVKKAFEALGLKRAFADPRESNGAQFEGMSDATDPSNKPYITKVLHKAFVEVNEKGTEAAAMTLALSVTLSARLDEGVPFTPVFEANKPFVFLIRDQKTGAILFMGRVVNPK